ISGNDEKKLTKKEEIRLRERIKARIAASRYTAEKAGEQPGGMAGRLRSRDKESTLNRVLTKDAGDKKGGKMKIGADDLNVHRGETRVAALGGGGASASAHPTAHLGGDSGLGQHKQPPIGFNRMG
ncbi:MAG: hypothetical protein Q7T50_05265, partial [Candidatus Magasanikbacteria bacterium]|nr:hypothetical protein [Candidatus Magasanikbacteria bacterium]